MNSFKSVCSVAKGTPVSLDELEENVEPLFGRQVRIELIICLLGIFKAAERLNDSFHGEETLARRPLHAFACRPTRLPSLSMMYA
jgi:hypothetical protein